MRRRCQGFSAMSNAIINLGEKLKFMETEKGGSGGKSVSCTSNKPIKKFLCLLVVKADISNIFCCARIIPDVSLSLAAALYNFLIMNAIKSVTRSKMAKEYSFSRTCVVFNKA